MGRGRAPQEGMGKFLPKLHRVLLPGPISYTNTSSRNSSVEDTSTPVAQRLLAQLCVSRGQGRSSSSYRAVTVCQVPC